MPPILWRKIRRDLRDDFSEREADGSRVIVWAHKQVTLVFKFQKFCFGRIIVLLIQYYLLTIFSIFLVSGCSNKQVFKRWIDQEPSPRHHVRFFLGNLEWWKKKDICVRKCFVHVVHLKCNVLLISSFVHKYYPHLHSWT